LKNRKSEKSRKIRENREKIDKEQTYLDICLKMNRKLFVAVLVAILAVAVTGMYLSYFDSQALA